MSSEECVDSFKRHLEPAQPEWRVCPRVQPDVNQLIVVEHGLPNGAAGYLHITRRPGKSIPIHFHSDAGAIHRPQNQRLVRIAGRLHFDCAEPPYDYVLENLLAQRTERVVWIGSLEIRRKYSRAKRSVRQFLQGSSAARLDTPLHSSHAIFNCVDSTAGNRVLRKPSQVCGRGLGHHVRAWPIRVDNGWKWDATALPSTVSGR